MFNFPVTYRSDSIRNFYVNLILPISKYAINTAKIPMVVVASHKLHLGVMLDHNERHNSNLNSVWQIKNSSTIRP